MTLIDQLNAHPRLSKAATAKHQPFFMWDEAFEDMTAVRAIVSSEEWPEDAVMILAVKDDELADVEALVGRFITEADEQAEDRYA